MKKTMLVLTAAAAIALTACGGTDTEPAPDAEAVATYMAGKFGGATFDEACIAGGAGWLCGVTDVDPKNTKQLVVTMGQPDRDPDAIAQYWLNNLSPAAPGRPNDSPMPAVNLVQVITATDGTGTAKLR